MEDTLNTKLAAIRAGFAKVLRDNDVEGDLLMFLVGEKGKDEENSAFVARIQEALDSVTASSGPGILYCGYCCDSVGCKRCCVAAE